MGVAAGQSVEGPDAPAGIEVPASMLPLTSSDEGVRPRFRPLITLSSNNSWAKHLQWAEHAYGMCLLSQSSTHIIDGQKLEINMGNMLDNFVACDTMAVRIAGGVHLRQA